MELPCIVSLLQLTSPMTPACRGGAEAAAGAAAEKAAAAAWQHMLANLPQKLDEFGRDENMELRDKMVRRHEQRQAAGQQKQHWQPGEVGLADAWSAHLKCAWWQRGDVRRRLPTMSTNCWQAGADGNAAASHALNCCNAWNCCSVASGPATDFQATHGAFHAPSERTSPGSSLLR